MSEPLAYRAEHVPQVFPIGRSVLFQLLKSGEIESFTVGRARFVPRESLVDFMGRRLAANNSNEAA